MALKPAVFIDKDGTLIDNVPYNIDPQKIVLARGAGPALKMLQDLGFALIVVTNQPGVARGLIAEAALLGVKARLDALLLPHGVRLSGFRYCPHSHETRCTCRKPMPGMLTDAAREHDIALRDSWMIGDILDDVEAGKRAGCRSVLIDNGNETEWVMSAWRVPDVRVSDVHAAAMRIASLHSLPLPATATKSNAASATSAMSTTAAHPSPS
jgi:histidinol-phosphate phosphatase family protein